MHVIKLHCNDLFFFPFFLPLLLFFLNTPEAKHDYTNDQLTTEADQLNSLTH